MHKHMLIHKIGPVPNRSSVPKNAILGIYDKTQNIGYLNCILPLPSFPISSISSPRYVDYFPISDFLLSLLVYQLLSFYHFDSLFAVNEETTVLVVFPSGIPIQPWLCDSPFKLEDLILYGKTLSKLSLSS